MHVVKVLEYYKATGGTFRWDAMVDDTKFELYIYKWRVPLPCPLRVSVVISLPDDNRTDLYQFKNSKAVSTAERSQLPVVTKVKFIEEHTKTQKYEPVGDREIGSIYIPKTLLPEEPPLELIISVEWLAG